MSAPSVSMYALAIHCAPRTEVFRLPCIAGSATLTTEPSMNAMLEPRIVAARIQGFARSLHPALPRDGARITPSSHAVRARPIMSVPLESYGAEAEPFESSRQLRLIDALGL